MPLGKHQRNDDGRWRRERADSKVGNLKKEYPALEDINGNMKLGTLREKLGVELAQPSNQEAGEKVN